jgi:hypothetical protein
MLVWANTSPIMITTFSHRPTSCLSSMCFLFKTPPNLCLMDSTNFNILYHKIFPLLTNSLHEEFIQPHYNVEPRIYKSLSITTLSEILLILLQDGIFPCWSNYSKFKFYWLKIFFLLSSVGDLTKSFSWFLRHKCTERKGVKRYKYEWTD